MAKVIDLTESDGDLVVLGRSIVLPSSELDSQPSPLNGALRFNPSIGKAQLFSLGAWVTLGEGTGGSSGDGSNNHTHSITQILGLQTALASKASLVHNHGLSDVTGLVTALADKAAVGHVHAVADVTGLQTLLNAKAALSHVHSFTEKEKIAACLPGSPPASFKLVWTATDPITIPANLVGSVFKTLTPPAQPYIITLFKNVSTNVGTITLNPGGSIQISFTAAVTMVSGDTLTFSLPARDTTIDTISLSVVTNRNPQTIA